MSLSSLSVLSRQGEALTVSAADACASEWDDFAARADHSTFCHWWAWREIMSDVLGHECVYLIARDQKGECQGILPLVRLRSALFGRHLLSMPFLNYGGPLGTPAAQTLLVEHAAREAQRAGDHALEIRSRHPVVSGLQRSLRKLTVVLDLPSSTEALWQNIFRSKLRSQIRRPQSLGMEVRFGIEQLPAFHEVFSRNMRDLGTPVLPRPFFESMAHTFRDQISVGTVYWNGQPVAAGCGFAWQGEFEMTWASSIRECNRAAPNMLLYFAFMEEMIAQEMDRFNFGRCSPGGGTHRFKQQWGGREVDLPWLRWSNDNTAELASPEQPIFRLATRIWQRLPLPLANRIGPWIARSLPF